MKKLCKLKHGSLSTSRGKLEFKCKKCGRQSDCKKSLCKAKKR